MDWMELLLSPLCGALGFGFALLYHLVRTKQMRRNLAIQLALLHNSPIGLIYVQNDRVLVNKTFCLMLGCKRPSRWESFLNLFSGEIFLSVQKEK